MKLVNSAEMRLLEERSAGIGVSLEVLMENAGLAIAEEVKKLGGDISGCRVLVLVGPGNNGGDGLVAARHIHDWGSKVTLCLCNRRTAGDKNFDLVKERGISSIEAGSDQGLSALDRTLSSAEIVIDAMFGTGKLRPLQGKVKDVLDRVRMAKQTRLEITIVAVDLPSGLDADSGAVDPVSLCADVTVTLGYPKVGLFAFPGAGTVGRTIVADIGIPEHLAKDIHTEVITPEWARSVLPMRPPDAHKGSFGRVLIAAGSENYIGAAYLACAAATRVGAGLVTLATARSLQPILAAKLSEVTYLPLPEAEPGIIDEQAALILLEQLEDYDVLLMGCGLGQHPATMEFVRESVFSLSKTSSSALVLDADALNTLAKTSDWQQGLPVQAVLTPHPAEMSRLMGLSTAEVQADRLGISRRAASDWQKVVVLKGAYTVIAKPGGQLKLNPAANPGLASAGTGDVLAGAIAGLLAQGLSPFVAASTGVCLHSMAGEMVREKLGDAGMVASDLLIELPQVIKRLRELPPQSGELLLPTQAG
ncbi:NAD(P)H-hydrate dehydratase [Chloroflexota bacterium]